MPQEPRQRATSDNSHGISPARRMTLPFSRQGKKTVKLHQESYGVYNGMTWDKLKGFLERKFPQSEYPGLKFKEDRTGDHWIFDVPERLTEDDKKALQRLRDFPASPNSNQQALATSQAQGRRSLSPE